jgi:hypothetical protein
MSTTGRDVDPALGELLDRLTSMGVGKVVEANCDICYAYERENIEDGTRGIVLELRCGGALVLVRWEESGTQQKGLWTSFDALDVVPS